MYVPFCVTSSFIRTAGSRRIQISLSASDLESVVASSNEDLTSSRSV